MTIDWESKWRKRNQIDDGLEMHLETLPAYLGYAMCYWVANWLQMMLLEKQATRRLLDLSVRVIHRREESKEGEVEDAN